MGSYIGMYLKPGAYVKIPLFYLWLYHLISNWIIENFWSLIWWSLFEEFEWIIYVCMYVYVDIFFNLIILKLFCFLPKNLLIIYLCIPKLGWVLWSVGIVHTWYKEEKAKIKELSNWWQLILLSYYLKMWACKIP